MSILTPRKYKKSSHAFDQDHSFIKPYTNNKGLKQQQDSQIKKYKNMVKDLESIIKQQKSQKQQLKERFQMLATRTALREREFHSILKSVHPDVIKFSQPGREQRSQKDQVMIAFEKIFANFQMSNEATNNFIQKTYIQNMNTMENKIIYIKQVFDQETAKFKKIASLDHLKVQREIQQVLQIAKQIQQDNIKTKKILSAQLFKNKLLESQKALMIEQVVQKKKLIAKLYMENKKLKQGNVTLKNRKVQSPQLFDKQELFHQFKIIEDQPTKISASKKNQKGTKSIERSQWSSNRGGRKYHDGQFITNQNFRNSRIMSHKSHRYDDAASAIKARPASISSKILSLDQKSQIKTKKIQSPKNQNLQSTIQHLKSCLEREKKRNIVQLKELSKILSQNQKLNAVLLEIVEQAKKHKKENKDSNMLDFILKSQKLFDMLQGINKPMQKADKLSKTNIYDQLNILEQFSSPNESQKVPQPKD